MFVTFTKLSDNLTYLLLYLFIFIFFGYINDENSTLFIFMQLTLLNFYVAYITFAIINFVMHFYLQAAKIKCRKRKTEE